MQLKALTISSIRNLCSIDLALSSQFNVFWGENGGGKTSLLEAIHILATGRSFRARQARQIITFGEQACTVSGLISRINVENAGSPLRIGIEKSLTGATKIRMAEQDCYSVALLAQALPLQLINSDSYDILEAAPQYRRQFLDWAMFHVEHSFYPTWQRFKRALQQRNAALREAKSQSVASIRAWDGELIQAGEMINAQRRAVLEEFTPLFTQVLGDLLDTDREALLEYQPGWDEDQSLEQALDRAFDRDRAIGYTTVGPHRADLGLLLGKVFAKNYLSRGQSKLYVCALLLARAQLLLRRHGRRSLFLIDDISAELDKEASKVLVSALLALGSQVLVTSIEGEGVEKLLEGQAHGVFQVKGGKIKPCGG